MCNIREDSLPKWLREAKEKVKADYEERLEQWKQQKESYPAQYAAAMAKQSELQGKIAALEQEKAQLKGFFTGKKRKELDAEIAALNSSLNAVELPLDPGEAPVLEKVYKEWTQSTITEKRRMAAAIFPAFRKFEERCKEFSKLSVGDHVFWGEWYRDNDYRKEPLQWRVLEKRGDALLLLTEQAIAKQKYHENKEDITWETCTLRKWLNETFLNDAFGEYERALIMTTEIDNSQKQGNPANKNAVGEENTQDQIFLLSYKEAAEDYFTRDEERICEAAPYVERRNPKSYGRARHWWLRSPGGTKDKAECIALSSGRVISNEVNSELAVRPALWINLEPDSI